MFALTAFSARARLVAHFVVLGAILMLAAVLRFHKLDAQSLWYDEGNSARIAERSLQLIVEGAAGDIHPPLYYIVLKYWRAVFGQSEAALRSFSVVCGVLTVLFTYLIGRVVFDKRAGLIAAFLLAVSPFAVYYSQEARMYALLALCAAASTFSIFSFASRSSILNSSLFVFATAAGLWTHYAYPFVMIAQAAAFFGLAIRDLRFTDPQSSIADFRDPRSEDRDRGRQSSVLYVLLNLIAVALYLPWAPIAIRQVLGWDVARSGYELGPALLDAYRTLIVGRTLPPDQAAPPVASFTVFAALGVLLSGRASWMSRLAMLVLAVLPLVLLFAFGLYRDAYLKFLLVCVLPLCVLAGRGITEIADRGFEIAKRGFKPSAPSVTFNLQSPTPISNLLAASIPLILAALFVPSLNNLYDDPAYARDDYRGIQRALATNARPDDAVLFIAPNQWEVYTYYQRDDRNLFPLQYRPATYQEVARQLEAISADHRRLFVLYFAERDADPEGWYEQWLGSNAFKAHEEWIGNIRLAVYGSAIFGDETDVVNGSAMFGDAIGLAQVRAGLGDVRGGDVVPLELIWHARRTPDQSYKVFIHVGSDDAPPIAQHDGLPAGGARPTTTWQSGEPIVDRRGVWIRPDAPADIYGVFVGMYDARTGDRLPITQDGKFVGDRLKIGEITIR